MNEQYLEIAEGSTVHGLIRINEQYLVWHDLLMADFKQNKYCDECKYRLEHIVIGKNKC